MSRTINTLPFEIQKKIREKWRSVCGYPGAYGGAWPGRKVWAKIRNRKYRRAATVALQKGDELPSQKRSVAYDIW